MSEPFIGQLSMVGFAFAPREWANCDGQSIRINQNQALFAIISTQFGGDGRTSFNLPELRGRMPIGAGGGYPQGASGGIEKVTITIPEMPSHKHVYKGQQDGTNSGPRPEVDDVFSSDKGEDQSVYVQSSSTNLTQMNPAIIQNNGSGNAHENMQPSIVIRYIIALQGIFPSRN